MFDFDDGAKSIIPSYNVLKWQKKVRRQQRMIVLYQYEVIMGKKIVLDLVKASNEEATKTVLDDIVPEIVKQYDWF